MRVLHVTDCYLPRVGGIEVHVSGLVAHQRAVGVDARVLTPTPADPGVPDPAWVARAGDTGLGRLVQDWTPDVVHVHVSVLSPFATLTARRCTGSGLPTLVTVHSMWSRLGPLPALAQSLLQLRRWPLLWSAVSDAAAQPLRAMLGPGIEVAVLPNAVDPEVWRPSSPVAPDAPVPTLLSVMRFTRTKRAMPLARMLREARRSVPADVPFRAVVVGDGPEHDAFARYVRRHGMDSWVELPGRLDRAEVRRRLDRADCFVAPARLESFGIAALEARAVGLPVIASRHAGVGEFVEHGRNGLLAADDHEMADGMARLMTDRTFREAIALHNRTTPVAHDWASALERTEELYDRTELLAARAALRAGARRRVAAPSHAR